MNLIEQQMEWLEESVKKTFSPVNYEEAKDKMVEAEIEREMLYPEDDEDIDKDN